MMTRPLDRLRVRPRAGAYGPVGTAADLGEWFAGAGLAKMSLDVRGVFAYFRSAQARLTPTRGRARETSVRRGAEHPARDVLRHCSAASFADAQQAADAHSMSRGVEALLP
jgi:hypothetical protein